MARELLLTRTNGSVGLIELRRALRATAELLNLPEVQRAELIAAGSDSATCELLVDSETRALVLIANGQERRFDLETTPSLQSLRQSLSVSKAPGDWADEIARGDAEYLRTARANQELANDRESAHSQVQQLERELEETNRGVMALYAELDDRASRLTRADDLKSRFLSYASHELRTPLNGIVGLVRLLMAGKPQGEELKQLTYVQKAAQEMREMVDDLLDLAKVEAGKITIHPSQFGLELVFGALRGMFRPLLNPETVELHFEDTSAVPSIYSDESKVLQILRNLISNALKFTERGQVRVWAEFGEADTVRICVKDTGIGIAPENKARVFEEFSQIEHPLQRKVKGTGLGLPLCKRLAELLAGRLELESQQGVGSTFTLVLPRVYVPANAEAEQPHTHTRPFTVLHVEDEEIGRYLVERMLRFAGPFRLVHAADGQAALEMTRSERPDLILLDLNLPRISGQDVLMALRAEADTSSIPVAILTAAKFEEGQIPAPMNHAIAILSKDTLADAASLEIEAGPPVRVSIKSN